MSDSIILGNFEAVHELTENDNFHTSIYESDYDGLLIARCNQNGAHPHQVTAILNGLNGKQASAELAELDRLRRELAEARAKLFPYADATEISGISFDGKYLIGDKKSISYFHEMKNRGEQIDVYARAYEQRISAAEAKLAEARSEAFKEAAQIAYATCAQTRHVTLGDACVTALRDKAEETRT